MSETQKVLLQQLYTAVEERKWAKARKLLDQMSDYVELGFLKIYIGIETDDESVVSDGIAKAKRLLSKPDKIRDLAASYYNLGNAYQYMAGKALVKNRTYFGSEKTIRSCIKNFEKSLSQHTDTRALVNLGNFYDEIGRPLESLLEYEKAIKVDSEFGMAIGNKAHTLESLAPISTYSTGYLIFAYQLYEKALSYQDYIVKAGGQKALEQFQIRKKRIEDHFKKNSKEDLLGKDLVHKKYSKKGLTREEIAYTDFCLANNLYLNLHIFDTHSSGSIGDTINTSFITHVADKESDDWVKEVFMRLNEIKESFVTGRYILWLSQQKTKNMSAISQQSVLVNNLDYTAHNLYTGLLKSAYKEGFSALDKIANTLNFYLDLGNPENEINYRNIWYEQLDKEHGFNSKIKTQNYRLFGVYSVVDELGTKPANIRNQLEHKYQRIGTIGINQDALTFDEFTKETVAVYYKIKCAVVYFLNFINSCENKKRSDALKNGGFIPTLPVITDQWLDLW